MFSVHENLENGFHKIVLQDDFSKTSAQIVPSCGGILQSFVVFNDGKPINVIDSYDNATDFKDHVTSKGFLGCKLSPFVCRINGGRYHFAEKDYRIEKYYSGNHALHGLLFDEFFTVVEQQATETTARVSMKYAYRKNDPGYPFNYDCIITYELQNANQLDITTTIENKDEGLIPIQDGWHPYFKLGGRINDMMLEFQSREMVEFDSGLIPTGNMVRYEEYGSLKRIGEDVFDNCFTLNFAECQPLCVLKNNIKKIEIEIIPDPSYPYLQIYTPSHRNSIAIENISSVPDAFNNGIGLKVLTAGESATFKTAYKIRLIP
jgi:Galactose mutarotase and related enzymes